MFRRVMDSYPHRMAVGEAWVPDDERLARYVRPDELHLTFNFRLVEAKWSAAEFIERHRRLADRDGRGRRAVHLGAVQPRRGPARHPLRRWRARPGPGPGGRADHAVAARCGLPLQRRGARPGERRAARRGAAGPDLGAQRAHRAGPRRRAGSDALGGHRAAVRVRLVRPVLAADAGRVARSSPSRPSWTMPDSTLSLYRQALRLRRRLPELHGPSFHWQQAPDGCLAYRRGPNLVVALNATDARSSCRRARCCWPRHRSTATSCRPTPRSGCGSESCAMGGRGEDRLPTGSAGMAG